MLYSSEKNRMGGLEWTAAKSKKPRPVESLILGDGAAENILEDVRAFLDSESWFIGKGIPFRRGYLLHGPPGTGKTSTIFTLAGALKLEVYILSLWGPRMNDVTLQELVSAIPKYAIVVIEDIDCIFPPGGDRGDFGSLDPHGLPLEENHIRESRVTLSGLLNVLDGVGSDEGRVLFGTTNRLEALDPALTRPGRFDIKVEYKLASSIQAKALFERFFSGTPESPISSSSDGEGTPGPDAKFHRDYLCMAVEFASAIPDQTFSMAELQGYLLTYHLDPRQAVRDIRMWIEKELLERDRLEKLRKTRRQTNFGVHFHPADSPSPAYLRVHDGDAMSSTAFSSTGSNGDLGLLEQ
ncbi:hypothetical protein EWM64_g4058 [Hericium alpestre]|uniref:AAA+ ATPase domain-containing protein n=1 Tax=Hericium alpestre TaxID=135208 RepID=A0A4Z0A0U2_9AGAM|nr:hypothetical protein EWM64_g4058 [Hericium alpestre]